MFVSARDGSIDSQPTIDSSNGTYYPTTLTATRPTVSHAVFSGSKWYKNGVGYSWINCIQSGTSSNRNGSI